MVCLLSNSFSNLLHVFFSHNIDLYTIVMYKNPLAVRHSENIFLLIGDLIYSKHVSCFHSFIIGNLCIYNLKSPRMPHLFYYKQGHWKRVISRQSRIHPGSPDHVCGINKARAFKTT